MTRMKTNVLLVCILATFIIIPFLPWQVLMLTDFVLVRVVLLVLFLAAINISPQVGMLSLASIAFLFIERNKRKMKHIQNIMQNSSADSPAIASIETPETAPEQPAFNTPSETSVPFGPAAGSGDNTFNPVAETINQKEALKTEPTNGSRFVVEKSFSWVNTDLIQQ